MTMWTLTGAAPWRRAASRGRCRAIPTGHDRRAGPRGEERARPRAARRRRALLARPLGEEHAAARPRASTASAGAARSRSAAPRWTGNAPIDGDERAEERDVPERVLGHEEDLAARHVDREGEVDVRAVDRRDDERARSSGCARCPITVGPEVRGATGRATSRADAPVDRRASRRGSARSAHRHREDLLHDVVDRATGRVEHVGVVGAGAAATPRATSSSWSRRATDVGALVGAAARALLERSPSGRP